jgi:alkylation response protein AidB-like acyl-CoA dehydrogenase
LRLVASNAETGSPQPVSSEDVPGGIRVNGTKTFNSNSGGVGLANVGFRREGAAGVAHALIPLDAEGVQLHGDWDNMGQRGTQSQKITYNNVFVPDGWHYVAPIDPLFIPLAFILHGSLVLGSGLGALDAGLAHIRTGNRVQITRFGTSAEDPTLMRRIGVMSAKLHAGLAYQRQVCSAFERTVEIDEIKLLMIEAFRLKTVCVEAGLEATGGLFDLTGARATASKYAFDRYWRNARTFACHDPVDVLYNWIGAWDLERKDPDLFTQFKL